MMQLVKSLRNGQVTIPSAFREKLDIDSDTFLQISLVEGELRLKPIKITPKVSGSTWFQKLHDQFGDVRKEAQSYPEKEIDQTIDKAVQAVRKSHA